MFIIIINKWNNLSVKLNNPGLYINIYRSIHKLLFFIPVTVTMTVTVTVTVTATATATATVIQW